jgi:hypothetical protein
MYGSPDALFDTEWLQAPIYSMSTKGTFFGASRLRIKLYHAIGASHLTELASRALLLVNEDNPIQTFHHSAFKTGCKTRRGLAVHASDELPEET